MSKEEIKRIDFVDLTKGVCIILVVMLHVGLQVEGEFNKIASHPILSCFRMPLYFFISGIFFKSYEGLLGFFIRKVNKLIIPFIFFYLSAFFLKYAIWEVAPGTFQLPVDLKELLTVFKYHELIKFNPPIWFLLALFNCNILFYIVHMLRKKYLPLMFVATFSIGACGYYMNYFGIELPLYMDVAMTALPFYVAGFWIRRYNFFLFPHRFDNVIPLFITASLVFLYFVAVEPGMRTNSYSNSNIVQFYSAAFAGIFMIMLLCKKFKKIKLISYLGHYSIITLGIHGPILFFAPRMVGKFIHNEWGVALATLFVTLLICLIATPICLKLIPQFVAQKDLLDSNTTHTKDTAHAD